MEETPKVFVSQPMRGRADSEIEEERADILKTVEAHLGQPISEVRSFMKGAPNQMSPLECLGKSLEIMSHANLIVFAEGWEEARGCRIEHECAVQYGYPILDLSDGQQEASL